MVEGPPPWRSVLYRGVVLIVFFYCVNLNNNNNNDNCMSTSLIIYCDIFFLIGFYFLVFVYTSIAKYYLNNVQLCTVVPQDMKNNN